MVRWWNNLSSIIARCTRYLQFPVAIFSLIAFFNIWARIKHPAIIIFHLHRPLNAFIEKPLLKNDFNREELRMKTIYLKSNFKLN